MKKILHEDDLGSGARITTSALKTPVLEVLDRPADGVVRLRDLDTQRVLSTTLWGLGLRSWRIGAGNARIETFLVATA